MRVADVNNSEIARCSCERLKGGVVDTADVQWVQADGAYFCARKHCLKLVASREELGAKQLTRWSMHYALTSAIRAVWEKKAAGSIVDVVRGRLEEAVAEHANVESAQPAEPEAQPARKNVTREQLEKAVEHARNVFDWKGEAWAAIELLAMASVRFADETTSRRAADLRLARNLIDDLLGRVTEVLEDNTDF